MSGLLFLTKRSNILCSQFDHFLKQASERVNKTLYVYLQITDDEKQAPTSQGLYRRLASSIYASESHFGLDCRVLFSHLKLKAPFPYKHLSNQNIKYIFTDIENISKLSESYFQKLVKFDPSVELEILNVNGNPSSETISAAQADDSAFNYSVLGGTFDHLHSGHKVLLSEAVMLTNRRLTVGVTDESMLTNKILSELIQPLSFRMKKVEEFLNDIDMSVEYDIVPISDPYGPSITDPKLQCIVVSEETYKGGRKVNDERASREMSELSIHSVEVVPDKVACDKISSTILRQRDLGTLRDVESPPTNASDRPYVIGLTGGIASGKTSVAKRLEKLGARIVDCDKLGHASYRVGSPAYKAIVEEFGKDVVESSTGEIDRKVLGSKVFSNTEELAKLNAIVWPEIARLVQDEINKCQANVVVVDAALLLEAGWDRFVDQIWVCLIPKDEAARRIVERNKVSESEALRRIGSQMTNDERTKKANVLFCTLWDTSVTQGQVESAWTELNNWLKGS